MIEQVILLGCLLVSFWLCQSQFHKLYGLQSLTRYTASLFWVIAAACFWLLPAQFLFGHTSKLITGIGTLATSWLFYSLQGKNVELPKPSKKLLLLQSAAVFLIFLPFLINIISNYNGWRLSIFAYNWDNGVHVLLYRSILETGKLPFVNHSFGLSASEKNYPFGFHAAATVVGQVLGIDRVQDLENKRILELNIFLAFLLFLYATLFLSLKALILPDSETKFLGVLPQISILLIEASLFTVLFWQPVVLSAAFLAGISALTCSLVFLRSQPTSTTLLAISPLFIFACLAWNPFSLIVIPLYLLLLFKIKLNFWIKLLSLFVFGISTSFLSVLQFFSTSIKIEHLNLPGQIFILNDLQLGLFSLVLLTSLFIFKATTKNFFYQGYVAIVLLCSLLVFLYQVRTNGGTNYYYYKFFMTIYPAFFVSSMQLITHFANQLHRQKIAIVVGGLMLSLFILETTHYQEFRNFMIGRFYMHKALYNIHLTHLNQGNTSYQASDLFDYWWGRAFLEPQRSVLRPQ